MALVEQTQEMKDAFGERFSQNDLTDTNPQYLMTEQSTWGGLEMVGARPLISRLTKDKKFKFSTKKVKYNPEDNN